VSQETAGATWAFVPLAPPGQLSEAGFGRVPDIGARLRLFLDAYELAGLPARCDPAYWPSGHVASSLP
jgi:hypothetical protein